MKIERKLILSNVFTLALLVFIGALGYQSLNLILAKLRFVEIADDLNATFLEMRLAEKNSFLYGDASALTEIQTRLAETEATVERVRREIVPAIGEENLAALLARVRAYSAAVAAGLTDAQLAEANLRARGQELREFSKRITALERQAVAQIISTAKKALFAAFAALVLVEFAVSHVISQRIVHSLRQIAQAAKAISGGNYQRVEGLQPRDETGLVVAAINSMSEELEKREEQIIQSKKLASLGILTAGVTHELTNPVNNISMIAQNLLELGEFIPAARKADLLRQIEEETERVRDIIRNLLDFSRPQGGKPGPAELGDILRKSLGLVQNMLAVSNIEMKLALAPSLPPVCVDAHQIQQVLVNLFVNAIQAMAPGGRLAVGTRAGERPGRVEVTVADTGKGIPAEHLPHVFDPFFSTKGVEGTGLGLSVSYGIVKNHGGDIRVESRVGAGTTFTVELPTC